MDKIFRLIAFVFVENTLCLNIYLTHVIELWWGYLLSKNRQLKLIDHKCKTEYLKRVEFILFMLIAHAPGKQIVNELIHKG